MDLGDLVVYGVMAFFFWSLAARILNYLLIKKIKNALKDDISSIIHEVDVEQVESMFYWYDRETKDFLGQGTTDDELIDHIKFRFPGHVFIVPEKGFLAPPDWTFQTDKTQIQLSKIIQL
jgi:hypothetical protein